MALRRYQRNLILVGVVVLLVLFVVVCATLFRPVSSRWLDRRIAQQIEQLTGLDVTFREAVFYFAQQRCVIKELVLLSRDSDHREVLTAGKANILFSLPSILLKKEKILHSMEIEYPSALPLVLEEGTIRLGEDLDFLAQLLEAANRELGKPRFMLERFQIEHASILIKSSIPPSRQPQVIADNVSMQFVLRPNGSRVMTLNASLPLLNNAKLRAFYTRMPHEPNAGLTVALTKASTEIPLEDSLRLAVASDYLSINARVDHDRTCTKLAGIGKIRNALVALDTEKPLFSDESLDFLLQATYDPSTAELALERSHLTSRDLDLYTSGSLTLTGSFPFNLSARAERIPTSLLNHYDMLFSDVDSRIDISDASVRLGASVEGRLAEEELPHFSGWLDVVGVRIWYPRIKEPLRQMQGTVEFENNRVVFSHVRGKIGQGDVAFAGQLLGKQVFWEPDVMEISWQASLRAEEILAAIPAQQLGSLRQGDVGGEIRGQGRLRKIFSPPPFPPSPSILAAGYVELIDVMVTHPSLPASIRHLNGGLNIKNDRIQFSNLEAKMGRSTVLASGSVYGKKAFWLDSQLDARVVMATPASTLLTLLRQFIPGQQVQVAVSGEAIVDARIKGPLYTLTPCSISAKAQFEECYMELEEPIVRTRLDTLEGAVEVRDGIATLNYLNGQVGDIPLNVGGWIKRDAARLVLKSNTTLESVKSLLPTVFDEFRIGGSVDLTAEIDVSAKSSHTTKSRISGEIKAHDVTFAYIDMPADVTHINGTFSFSQNELRILNVLCWCGGSKDCTVNGVVRFSPQHTVFDFHLKSPLIYLDEWMYNWPKRKDIIVGEARQVLRETSPTLEILGSIDAGKAHCGPLEGGEFRGAFHYQSHPFGPNTFYYDNIQVSVYQGDLSGSGSILFPKGDNTYEAKAEAKQINLNQLFEALGEKKQTIGGRLSATVSLVGQGSDINTLQGDGKFAVEDSRFIDNITFKALGRVLRSRIFNDISFTQVMGDYYLKDGAVHFSKLSLRNPMLQMQANGKIGFNRQVELNLQLAFLSAYLGGNIPIMRDIMAAIENLGSKIFKFRINGTLDQPRVAAVPLSFDEVNKILFPKGAQ